MEQPISVVICTRNRGDKIGAAVRSVLANEHPSFDLTIIDQSTNDDTRLAVERIAGDDARVHYVHVDEPGLSRAYNTTTASLHRTGWPTSTPPSPPSPMPTCSTGRSSPPGWRRVTTC